MAGKLAINGGKKIREGKSFPSWPRFGKREEDALLRVLNSGCWGIGGEETDNFEKTFAAYQHCQYCVTMTNGTVTLRNSLLACGLEEGRVYQAIMKALDNHFLITTDESPFTTDIIRAPPDTVEEEG